MHLIRKLPRSAAVAIAVNIVITFTVSQFLGPSTPKLQAAGISAVARVPFYLLQLYIAPTVIALGLQYTRTWYGLGVGLAYSTPLAIWSVATVCPLAVGLTYLCIGCIQGALSVWIYRRLSAR